MGRLVNTEGLTEEQTEILKVVRQFVEKEILPVATELEHKDEYPTAIVEGLKALGILGLMIPGEYDGPGGSLRPDLGGGWVRQAVHRASTGLGELARPQRLRVRTNFAGHHLRPRDV